MAAGGPLVRARTPPALRTSVVVLTYNRAPELARTLAHTLALPERPPVIVVDNGSSDGTADLVGARFPEARLIRLRENFGAAARNIGARSATTPYVAFSDDDTLWAAGSLARAEAMLDAHPRVAVLSARVLVGAERREDAACAAMAASPLPSAGLPGRAVVGFLAGAAVFRRDAFFEAGGYEPRFFIGGEEALLAYDLLAHGWRIVYSDRLTVHHHPSSYRDAHARRRLLLRNALWVAWLRRPFPSALARTLRVLWSGLPERAAFAGCVDALRGLPWVLRNRRVIPPHVEAMRRQARIGD
jgi:GT2 family glycosyltransferase